MIKAFYAIAAVFYLVASIVNIVYEDQERFMFNIIILWHMLTQYKLEEIREKMNRK